MAYEEEKGAEFVDPIAATLNQRASMPIIYNMYLRFILHTPFFCIHTPFFLPL